MREQNPTPAPGPAGSIPRLAVWLAAVVIAIAGVLVARDWADPCRGQITDLLGCLTAEVAAERAELADVWLEWCAEVEARYVSPDGLYIHAAYESDYERGCVPGTDMLTLDDTEGLP